MPTPIVVGDRLLVCSENQGTRLYGFNPDGKIDPRPLAVNPDLAPDCHTPVVVGDRVFGVWSGLYCLDLKSGLKNPLARRTRTPLPATPASSHPTTACSSRRSTATLCSPRPPATNCGLRDNGVSFQTTTACIPPGARRQPPLSAGFVGNRLHRFARPMSPTPPLRRGTPSHMTGPATFVIVADSAFLSREPAG